MGVSVLEHSRWPRWTPSLLRQVLWWWRGGQWWLHCTGLWHSRCGWWCNWLQGYYQLWSRRSCWPGRHWSQNSLLQWCRILIGKKDMRQRLSFFLSVCLYSAFYSSFDAIFSLFRLLPTFLFVVCFCLWSKDGGWGSEKICKVVKLLRCGERSCVEHLLHLTCFSSIAPVLGVAAGLLRAQQALAQQTHWALLTLQRLRWHPPEIQKWEKKVIKVIKVMMNSRPTTHFYSVPLCVKCSIMQNVLKCLQNESHFTWINY